LDNSQSLLSKIARRVPGSAALVRRLDALTHSCTKLDTRLKVLKETTARENATFRSDLRAIRSEAVKLDAKVQSRLGALSDELGEVRRQVAGLLQSHERVSWVSAHAESKKPKTPMPALAVSAPETWEGTEEFRARRYESYDQYLEHQAAKLRTLNLVHYNVQFKAGLHSRLGELEAWLGKGRGANVLCLGARNGAECEVFAELGFFPIGIDLNPGEANKFVVTGDFHNLQFADQSVDVVFTNTLDHAFELPKILVEVKRVLKPGGVFIAEIVRGSKDEGGREPGAYEAVWWDHSETVVKQINSKGFTTWKRQPFDTPWAGDQYAFTVVSR